MIGSERGKDRKRKIHWKIVTERRERQGKKR